MESMPNVLVPVKTAACVLCFLAKNRCIAGDKPCCSRTTSYQSPYIGEDVFESRIIAKVRTWSEIEQTKLVRVTHLHNMLECQPTADSNIGDTYHFGLKGRLDDPNYDFVAQLDHMVANTFAPKISAANEAMNSIALACLGVGYCNMLIFANLQDSSDAILDKPDLSPVIANLAIKRINELTANRMNMIRRVQYNLDEESRSWVILWYLYSSIIRTKLKRLGHCKFVNTSELHKYLMEIFESFRKELTSCLAEDCKNKAQWAVPFNESQRSLKRKLEDATFWTLSVKWVAWPTLPIGHIHKEPLQVPQTNHQLGGAASVFNQLDEASNGPLFSTTWAGLAATASPPPMLGFPYDDLPLLPDGLSGATDLNFGQAFDIGIEPFANQQNYSPGNPQPDYYGDSHTFSWH